MKAEVDPPFVGDIMFVTRKWAPAMGGMETYSLKLTEQLARTHQVDVVALPGRANGLPPRSISLLGFPFVVLRRYFSRNRPPAVLHLGDMSIWPLGLLSALREGDPKVVLSAHGTDVSYPRRRGIRGRLYGAYLRLGAQLLKRASIIANSRTTADALQDYGWRITRIVPLATNLRGTEPDGRHDNTLFFAGRLIRRKGLGWFVREVLPRLPQELTLRVAGVPWDQDEQWTLGSPRVEFLGNLSPDELREAYARALCVILPNIPMANGEFEGFGLVAAEAAASGGVVLAADQDGLREAVLDKQTGFLLAPGDPEAWQRKINLVRAWPVERRNRFLSHSIRLASEHYSWRRVASETTLVYQSQERSL